MPAIAVTTRRRKRRSRFTLQARSAVYQTRFAHGIPIPLQPKTRYGMAMTEAQSLLAASRARPRSVIRRIAARLVAWASDEKASVLLVASFVVAHVVLWTVILTQLKAAQDVHFDVAEAFAWGQK